MQASEIVEKLKSRKGQHVLITWQRPAATLSKFTGVSIGKRTSAYVRAGINYANLSKVQSGIAAGTRDDVQSLPKSQEWEQFPFIIRRKDGTRQYVRLYPATFDNLTPSVEWTLNGVPSTYEAIEPYLMASEKRKNEDKADCFSLPAEYVTDIAGE